MPNAFDEFDGAATATAPAVNPFDEFDAPAKANAFDEFDARPGEIGGTVNEFKRGLLAGQQQIVAFERANAPKGPTIMQTRRAFVKAMSDPAYMDAVIAAQGDPRKLDRAETLLGPNARGLREMRTRVQANKDALDNQLAELEQQQQAIPQSEAMKEWGTADNSNWFKVLAKNPAEITAGIMAQSLPAMAPALAMNMAAPGGRMGKAIASGVGSGTTEAANSYLDAARNAGYDLTDPDKVREFFDNPEAQANARLFAAKRGVPIAFFDALTAGLAGKFAGPALREGSGIVKASAKEVAMQAAGGAAGEAAAQVTSGQKFSVKDIVAEALGEIGSAPSETLSNTREARARRQEINRATVPPAPPRPVNDELPPAPSEPTLETPAIVPNSTPPPAPTVPPAAESSTPPAPVPESVATLQAQFAATLDPETPKAVTLVTPGEETGPVPDGLLRVSSEHGVFWFNPKKTSAATVREAAAKNAFGTLLGMSQEQKPKGGSAVVQAKDAKGTPVLNEVVTPETAAAAVEAAKAVAPEGTVEVKPAEQVIAEREASRRPETQPISPPAGQSDVSVAGEAATARGVSLTPRHLAEARSILRNEDTAPTVVDELQGHGIGRVRFEPADYGDLIQNVRERISQQMFDKPWNKLRKPQREKVDAAHNLSTDAGTAADQALNTLARENPKYAELTIDDFAEQLAASARVEPTDYTAAERALAQQIAAAEASPAEVSDFDQAAEATQRDRVDEFLTRAIDATDPVRIHAQGNAMMGVPVWITATTANAVLRVVRATYRGTKNLAQAIQAGLDWLRAQNVPGYNEAEAKDWLARNVTTTPEDDDINFREFQDQMDQDAPLNPEVAAQVTNLLYERRQNETDAPFAARVIQAVGGPAAAIEVFNDGANGLPGAVRMFLGQLILKQLGLSGQHEAAARFYDDHFAAHVTDTAQSLQSLAAFLALTPEGKVVWAQRQMRRAANDQLDPVTPDLQAAADALQQANAQGIEAATAAPDVQAAARNAVDAALDKQGTTYGTEIQQAIMRAALQQLVDAGLITQREMEITLLHLEAPGNTTLEAKLQSAGISDPKKRAQAILDGYKKRATAEQGKVKMRAARARKPLAAGSPDTQVDAAIRKAMHEMQVKLGRVIRDHHTKADAAGRSLAEKIAAASGLNEADAAQLAEAVQRRFKALVSDAKRRALEKLLKPVQRRGLARPDLATKLIELTNLGAVNMEQFWNAVRKQLNLPQWTPQIAGSIRQQAEAIERIPDDQIERKQKAQVEMLNTVERAKGLSNLDLGLAFYLTNILTGVTTHAKNLLSTGLNSTMALGIEASRAIATGRPGDLVLAWTALGEGIKKGGRAAADVLRTGVVTGSRLQKLEPGRALEITRFGQRGGVPTQNRVTRAVLENRLASFLNAWKYNYRLMAAEDLLFFKPAEEAKAALLAKRIARSEGLTGAAAQDRARVILGYGRPALDAAETQAMREGLARSAFKRRVAEILESQRPEQLREDARQYALRTTFNNDPYGALGFVAGLLNRGKAASDPKIRVAFNLITPFTNIVSNVVNESLNFTPVGLIRARGTETSIVGRKLSELSLDERKDLEAELRTKALLGTGLLAAVALKAASHLDDDDPEFAIYAGGPGSPDDRKGWQAAGGIGHSVKIGSRYYSYSNTPMALPFAWLGNIMDKQRDARKYNQRSAQRIAQDLPLQAATAFMGMPKVITEQSFLTGLMDVAQMIQEPNAEVAGRSGLKTATRIVTSAVVPNAVRQVDRFFDPQVYEQRDLEGMIINAIPFVRGKYGQPALNALGQPVVNPPSAQFTSSAADTDPLVKFLAETGNWPSLPNPNQIYPRQGRTMTDEEYYQYVGTSGQAAMDKLRTRLNSNTLDQYRDSNGTLKTRDAKQRAQVISEIVSAERAKARARMGF